MGRSTFWCTESGGTRRVVLVTALLACGVAARGRAQHEHAGAPEEPTEVLGIPMTRIGSGTAWLPDAAPMPGYHGRAGGWTVMAHGSAFLQYDRQFGTRGDYQVGSVNWLMVGLVRDVAGGVVRLRALASAEPWTLTDRGYPQLLQSAEPYPNRQHPHHVVSEAAVAFEHAVGSRVALSLYAAPVGEPALGPVFYLHRPLAALDPTAPLGHHAQDFTHTSFGVVTWSAFSHNARVEASAFNGTHPDSVRTNFDAVRLDSYAVRLSLNPSSHWALAAWFGHLAPTQSSHAHEASDRFGASALLTKPFGVAGQWSTALVYSADLPADAGHPLNSVLLETTLQLDRANALFGRAEYVRRTAGDLALVGSVSRELDTAAVSLGYQRRVLGSAGLNAGVGAKGTLNLVPEELRLFYGSRTPAAVMAYLLVRPSPR